MKIVLAAHFLICCSAACLGISGCGSSDSSPETTAPMSTVTGASLSVGQKLYRPDGSLFGTIVQLESAHQFENGAVEPGALVDYGPPMGTAWLPQRSAASMAR